MALELRKTGISIVGDMPWGTHYCLFYESKQDLLDILVPYFKTGLENKEFCLWVVSNAELMTVEEAKAALKQAVPDLDRRLADENIEILNGLDWYLKENVFNLERVTSAWDARLKRALDRGYDGLRVSGDTFWLAEKDWKDFYAYENQLNDSITDRPMIVLCTYPLAKSGAAEVLDVVQTHQFAIARQQGEWKVIEVPALLQAKAEIKRLNEELEHRVKERSPRPPVILSFGVAVLTFTAALIITLWMRMELGQESTPIVSLFLCAVMFSAWFGGVGPGLLAIALSLLAFDYYFLTPIYSLTVDINEIPRLLIFALSALFVGSLSGAQRSAAESLRHARDVLDRTVQALKRTNEALRAEITERKQAETLLHAKEQEFRAIVENAPDQIISYDREFRRAYVNPAVAKAYGLPVEALIDKPVGSAIREAGLDVKEDELAQFRQRIAAVFATGTSYEYEMNWTMPAGRRYYSVRLFPELDLNGSVINVLGIARDITERKRAEDDLRTQTEILQTIFDHIPVMISFYDANGRIKLVNRAYERTLEWSLEEIQQHNLDIFAEYYPDPLSRQRVLDFIAAATGEWADFKTRVRDGRVIDTTWANIRLADGTAIGIGQNITARKLTEEALRRSESNFRTLADKSLQGIAIFQDQKIVYANPAQSAVLGYTLEELKSMSIEQIIALTHPIDRPIAVERIRKRIAGEEISQFIELRILRKDGSSRWIQSFNNLIEYNGQPAILTASVDITERKQAEANTRSLLQISEKLHATLDIDALLDSLVIEAMKLIDAEMGWSGLRTEEGMVCHTHIARDLQVVPFNYVWPPGVGLPGWVLVHKVPYVMNDAQSDKVIIPEIRERFGVNAAIDTPILDAQGEVIGFFEVNNKKNGAGFSESDVEKLVAVSRIASIALQNAMSYRNLERAEKALRESQLHLQRLSRQLLQAQEAERRSIARELHDEIGQRLTGLGLLLSSQHPSPDQLTDAQAIVRDLIARLRDLSLDLRPTILDDLGLFPALVWLFERYTAQTNVSVRFEHRLREEQRFDPDVETTAYRIVQEALTNVARHAGVREATVRLWMDDDTLTVVIVDQGRGFDPQTVDPRRSSGLSGMQERAALLGGSVTIEGGSEQGTRLTATLPLTRGKSDAQEQSP